MQYFLLGLTTFALLLLATRWLMVANPHGTARKLRVLAGMGVGVLGLLLAVRGAIGLAIPLFGFAFALLSGMTLGGRGKKSSGSASGVTTEYLEMALDHDSGTMAGRVLKGPFTGRLLAELSLHELIDLWADCARTDQQSAQLMEAYLDRTSPEWREMAGVGGNAEDGGERTARPAGPMTRAEALMILGLGDGASEADIRQAHRRLMKQYHPDQGGSDYLASKINEAKDLLLGNGRRG